LIVPIFLPHLGCNARCIYCDQGYITDVHTDDVPTRIEKMLEKVSAKVEIGLYGGNIFGVKPSDLNTLFGHFSRYTGKILNFRISTKPTPLSGETLQILKENGVTIIELGMPCFNDVILEKLNRRHTVGDLYKAFYLLKEAGFRVALQVMVGLPDETMDDIKRTAEQLVRLSPAYIRIYPLVVLKDTPLHRMYERESFVPIRFEEAVDRAVYIYLNALKHGVKTVKMGLTDSGAIQGRVIAGHYHPAFGYMVKSRAFYLSVKMNIEATSMKGQVIIQMNSRDIPHLLGNKRSNIKRFEERGVHIAWEKTESEEGCFVLTCDSKEAKGTIFDALMAYKPDSGW
jgi:histone acetyltransferase (RNA polymerase elongator complex component)